MKLYTLSGILSSYRGHIQYAILFDSKTGTDVDRGTVDYLVDTYGQYEVIRIEACDDQLVITI